MYVSQDPIRLDGGFALYHYVGDINSWIDIFGLRKVRDCSNMTKEERATLVAKRPTRFRAGVVQSVWDNAKNRQGKVFDPNNKNKELTWDKSRNRNGQWDMGHRKGKDYDTLKNDFINGDITYKEYLDEYNNPKNYYPEDVSSNRSNKYT